MDLSVEFFLLKLPNTIFCFIPVCVWDFGEVFFSESLLLNSGLENVFQIPGKFISTVHWFRSFSCKIPQKPNCIFFSLHTHTASTYYTAGPIFHLSASFLQFSHQFFIILTRFLFFLSSSSVDENVFHSVNSITFHGRRRNEGIFRNSNPFNLYKNLNKLL